MGGKFSSFRGSSNNNNSSIQRNQRRNSGDFDQQYIQQDNFGPIKEGAWNDDDEIY